MTGNSEAAPALYCRNCSLFLSEKPGRYCPHCGQETAPHPPSLGEFIHEFVGHYIALEGPLLRTLGLLFFRPGELTREYLQGRKRRYVLPLRLYLSISLVFFLVVGSLSGFDGTQVKVMAPGGKIGIDQETLNDINEAREDIRKAGEESRRAAAAKIAAAARAADKMGEAAGKPDTAIADIEAEKKSAADSDKAVEKKTEKKKIKKPPMLGVDAREYLNNSSGMGWDKCNPQWLCTRLKHRFEVWNSLPPEGFAEAMKTRALHAAPIAMFILLPLYALLLKIIYFNRRMYFGEHLVFSFHLHSFMFLLMMVMLLPVEWLGSMLFFWLIIYPVFALRRVYGGRWLPTLLRSFLIFILYMLALIPALLIFSVVFLAA